MADPKPTAFDRDAATFFGSFLAGVVAQGRYDMEALPGHAKRMWNVYAELREWVELGGPERDRKAEIAKREEHERKVREDKELCDRLDAERLQKAIDEHGKIVANMTAAGSATRVA